MSERIADLGGVLNVAGGRGVIVRAEIPLTARRTA
jgi:signal transduction histidine kinase